MAELFKQLEALVVVWLGIVKLLVQPHRHSLYHPWIVVFSVQHFLIFLQVAQEQEEVVVVVT
jgi:hypothetical protein